MRRVLTLLVLGVASLPAADLVLTGATVYTAPDAPAITNASVLVHEGKIAAVGPRASVRVPQGAQSIDCTGKFIVTGFWNSHVHFEPPAFLNVRDAKATDLTASLDAMLNRWGFTTVFDIASMLENTQALRKRIDSGELRGPHILTVGEPIETEVPIYAKGFLEANHITLPVAKTPADAAAQARSLVSHGADGIKLFTGSFQGDHVDNMPVEMVKAATAIAHEHHLPVFAHPQNTAGLNAAIDGGVDILAHTVPDSPAWTPELVARIKNAHMALIPTLTLWDVEARKANMKDADREGWITAMIAQLHAYLQAGGEILFGTDVGYTDHFDTAMEYAQMARAGMTFPQILASLTTTPAKRFGASGHYGKIAPGMDGDLVVLDGDPAKDITALSKVRLVIRGGAIQYKQ